MIKVFLSYSHQDEALRNELNKHLGALRHEKIIDTWCDHQIQTGSNWSIEILDQLEAADLILLLVSPDFINSQFCYVEEMRRAVERHGARQALVVPIILRPCYWEPSPFSKIQGLPKGMIPVTTAPTERRDEIWAEVAKGIHEAAMTCSAKTGIRVERNAAPSTVTMLGMLLIDEAQLDSTIRNFKKGDTVTISWPKSSDRLISVANEAIKKFDENPIESAGKDKFLSEVPRTLRNSLRYRSRCEKRLPELLSILSDFGEHRHDPDKKEFYRDCVAEAIKYYLLRANFFGHWHLAYLSSWEGLSKLDLRAPEAWIGFQDTKADDKFVSQLYGKEEFGVLTRLCLHEIGKYSVAKHRRGGSPYIYIRVPRWYLNKHDRSLTDERTLCRWAIPQVELENDMLRLPDLYNGEWRTFEG